MAMKPDDFELWAEQKGPPWDADYAMIAWTVHEMPPELREAYLLASEDGARYADVARVCGVTEEVARRRVIDAANMVGNGKRALTYRSHPTLRSEHERKPHPVDADIETMVDYISRALSKKDEARHERRMRSDERYFDKVAPIGGMWRGDEDLRDLISRIDQDKPPRLQVNRALDRSRRKLMAVVQGPLKGSRPRAAKEGLTMSDCMRLLRWAGEGDERIPMHVLSELAAIECARSGAAARRWSEALHLARLGGEVTMEQAEALTNAFRGREQAEGTHD
jgi:hypothetical protein